LQERAAARRPRPDREWGVSLLVLVEAATDQVGEGGHRGPGLGPVGGDLDLAAVAGAQHQQAHDRQGVDRHPVAGDADLGVETRGQLDEFGAGPGVQATRVADAGGRRRRAGHVAHFSPCSTQLATEMYLRPASWAWATQACSGSRPRTLASLISIGRLRPAMTSAPVSSITEMARLEGVPPNMSVSRMTPSPSSTACAASTMSRRRRSMSSSGPMQMAATPRWGPTTCSMAERNSEASPPWLTITRPIMKASPRLAPPRPGRPLDRPQAARSSPNLRRVKVGRAPPRPFRPPRPRIRAAATTAGPLPRCGGFRGPEGVRGPAASAPRP